MSSLRVQGKRGGMVQTQSVSSLRVKGKRGGMSQTRSEACSPHHEQRFTGLCQYTLIDDGKPNNPTCESGPSHGTLGSWSLANLHLCIARCDACPLGSCNFVSFDKESSDCAWFKECDTSTLKPAAGRTTFAMANISAQCRHSLHSKKGSRPPTPRAPSIEWIPSVYREWGGLTPSGSFSGMPSWEAMLPNRTLYQRLGKEQPNFLPNVGNEMNTYLHHIAIRYHSLADVTIFTQADVDYRDVAAVHCLRRNLSWVPLASSQRVTRFRPGFMGLLGHPCKYAQLQLRNNSRKFPAASRCLDEVVGAFGLSAPNLFCPNLYLNNNFAVSAAAIRRFPHAVWERAYRQWLEGRYSCDLQLLGPKAWGSYAELLGNLVFGNRSTDAKRLTDADWCAAYLPQSECPLSPCL